MENKVCKKCQKPLPEGYKHKQCESCRNAQVQGVKKGLGVAAAGVGAVAVAIAALPRWLLQKKK